MPLADRIDEGLGAEVTLSDFPSLEFFPITITPPGYEASPIDTTTLNNTTWQTMVFSKIKRMTPMTMQVRYTRTIFKASDGQAMVGRNNLIRFTLPDGVSYIEAYGGVMNFNPDSLTTESATASITIMWTLEHPTTKVETPPTISIAP